MATTTNLELTKQLADTATGSDFFTAFDGNMDKIDTWAGGVNGILMGLEDALDAILGV